MQYKLALMPRHISQPFLASYLNLTADCSQLARMHIPASLYGRQSSLIFIAKIELLHFI